MEEVVVDGACIFRIGGVPRRGDTFGLALADDGVCPFVFSSCRASTAFKVGAGMSDDGMMHSDHRPVFVDLSI